MDLGEFTNRDIAVNAAAKFYPAARTTDPGDLAQLPCIEVGGVQVYAYVRDGALVVSLDFDTTDPDVFDLYGPEGLVPVQVKLSGEEVYEASAGQETGETPDNTRALAVAAVDLWRNYPGNREDFSGDLLELLDNALRQDEQEARS